MSVRDAIRSGETIIPFLADLTIEDIMYISTKNDLTLHPHFDEYFKLNENTSCHETDYITICQTLPKKSADLIVLLYAIYSNDCHDNFYIKYDDDDIGIGQYIFAGNFLENCWELACRNNLDHQIFGDTIKKLGYSPIQDYSDFQCLYLDHSPNIKSARNCGETVSSIVQ